MSEHEKINKCNIIKKYHAFVKPLITDNIYFNPYIFEWLENHVSYFLIKKSHIQHLIYFLNNLDKIESTYFKKSIKIIRSLEKKIYDLFLKNLNHHGKEDKEEKEDKEVYLFIENLNKFNNFDVIELNTYTYDNLLENYEKTMCLIDNLFFNH